MGHFLWGWGGAAEGVKREAAFPRGKPSRDAAGNPEQSCPPNPPQALSPWRLGLSSLSSNSVGLFHLLPSPSQSLPRVVMAAPPTTPRG